MKNSEQRLVLWLTGLSGSGKTTTANNVLKYLKSRRIDCEHLDGDVIRRTVTADLGFSRKARNKNIAIAGRLAKEFSEAGKVVIASFISPYLNQREKLRQELENFIEIYMSCSLVDCEKRDVKGLYKKARAEEIVQFTGISDVYEPPQNPELELDISRVSEEECVRKIINYLRDNQLLNL